MRTAPGDHGSGNGGMRIDYGDDVSGSLLKTASRFLEETTHLPLDIQQKMIAIADLGDFLGDKGQRFRAGYDEAALNAVGYVNALALTYATVSTNLTNMATNMRDAEWANIAALPTVSDGPTFSSTDGTVKP